MGNDKYSQLGRKEVSKADEEPKLVDEWLGEKNNLTCVDISCGWSHNVVKVEKQNRTLFYGWGRNDKGQLGTLCTNKCIQTPQQFFCEKMDLQEVCCGAESTFCMDSIGNIFSCGWNEHGNLSINSTKDSNKLCSVLCDGINGNAKDRLFAAGGAHFLLIVKPNR